MEYQWHHKIFGVKGEDFEQLTLEIFRYQYAQNPLYREYVNALNKEPGKINRLDQIPFLPIRFFKSHPVKTGEFQPELSFESSGTTSSVNSRHFVKDASLYGQSFIKSFQQFYGSPGNYCILGLLPSYLERSNASLVYMVNELIKQSGHLQSGFYLHDQDRLAIALKQLEQQGQKTLLIGVSFALLDLAEKFPMPLRHTIVMETGGMKGRRKEMIREELHTILKNAFHLDAVHSEYGMTELLSQAWSAGNGIYKCPPWMKILLRDEEDPFTLTMSPNQRGAINIIDLANIHSCSFIATDDAGRLHEDSFEVIGRRDGSDLRGCSLMSL